MKYSFKIGIVEYPDGHKRSYPYVDIEDSLKYGWVFNSEITHLNDATFIRDLVEGINKVMLGIHEQIDFGFEAYSIECRQEATTVISIYEDNKVEAVIPTQEVYELMRDWRDYLIEWNKNKSL